MDKTRKNRTGAIGKPMFLRLNDDERWWWNRAKSKMEKEVGQPISHALFASMIVKRYAQ